MTPDTDFGWVKARYECYPEKVFTELRIGAERDVKARNETLPANAGYSFTIQSDGGMFSVVLVGNRLVRGVDVVLGDNRINVRREDGDFEATLTLNDQRQCRLKIGDREFECWQFRKWALEDLFFNNPWRKGN